MNTAYFEKILFMWRNIHANPSINITKEKHRLTQYTLYKQSQHI